MAATLVAQASACVVLGFGLTTQIIARNEPKAHRLKPVLPEWVYPCESKGGLPDLKSLRSEYFVSGIVQRPAGTITLNYEPNF